MALFLRPTTTAGAATKGEAGGALAAATDQKTTDGKAVTAEWGYILLAFVLIIGGTFLATHIYYNWADAVSFTAPEGVGIFALFYVVAQGVERLQEPFVARLPVGSTGESQSEAKAKLEAAFVVALSAPSGKNDQAVADRKRDSDQVRANLTAVLFGSSALLALLAVGYLKAGFLTAVGVSGVKPWFNLLVTGIVVGGGSKPLHDLISNLSKSSEAKDKLPGTE